MNPRDDISCTVVLSMLLTVTVCAAQPTGLRLVWSKKPVTNSSDTVKVVSRNGNIWSAGHLAGEINPGGDVFVARLDSEGDPLWTRVLGGASSDAISGLAVDDSGNSYVVGTTRSADFPLQNAFQSTFPPREPSFTGGTAYTMAFLTKLDPQGRVVYSTLLGGADNTESTAVAVDQNGSAVVVGYTWSNQFPTTAGAPIRTFNKSAFNVVAYAFIARFNAAGNGLLYSTLLGGERAPCVGGSRCLGATGQTVATAIAVDTSGNAYVTGSTIAADFPVTPGAVQSICNCEYQIGNDGFVTKLNGAGTQFLYSTYLGGSSPGWDYPRAIAIDSTGAAYIAGGTSSGDFPVTSNAIQPRYQGCTDTACVQRTTQGFVTQLSPSGGALLYSTYIGAAQSQIESIVFDGFLWLSGSAPGDTIGALGADHTLLLWRRLPPGMGGASLAVDSKTIVTLAGGSSGLITRLDTSADGPPYIAGVMSATGTPYRDRVSPGEVITVFGINVGPRPPATARAEGGLVGTDLAGASILFNGIAAPLLYANDNQINAVVPFSLVRDTDVNLVLNRNGEVGPSRRVRVVGGQPEVFKMADGVSAAAVNQNGTINSSANPADPGEIISFWATGGGDFYPRPLDGELITSIQPQPLRAVWAEIEGNEADLFYAGFSPGLVAGVMQFNVRIPLVPSYGEFQVRLESRDYTSLPAVIHVRCCGLP